ncbi:MAG: gliding motility-associated C-terminal domain-containing protein [Prevotellaceae bacterium]|jgi:gliding motility-associated-like protein|nr:gliding motility-associated C-terminal domain-containing protein [Prevotellaceae bacterium]
MKKILILIFLLAVATATMKAQTLGGTFPSNDIKICLGEGFTINFTGTPPFTLYYYFNASGNVVPAGGDKGFPANETIINGNSLTITPTEEGIYQMIDVVVSDGSTNAALIPSTVSITVNPKPAKPVINALTDICFGETLTFETAAGYPSYRWRINGVATASTDNTVIETAVGTYTYEVSVQNAEGCWSDWSDAVTATVNPKPAKPVINALTDICFGETLTFETVAGYPRYRWRINGATTAGANNTVIETAVGTYTYQVRVQNAEGCWSDWSDAVTATVNPKPAKPSLTASDTEVCFGEAILLTAPSGFSRYRWRETATMTTENSTDFVKIIGGAGSYAYQVRVQNAEGCWSDWSDIVNIKIRDQLAHPVIEPVSNVCFGSPITFTATPGYAEYIWYEGYSFSTENTTANTVSVSQPAMYSYLVTVKDDLGCTSPTSVAVNGEIYAKPDKPVINALTDVCFGNPLTFGTTAVEPRYNWRKTFNGSVSTTTGTNNTVTEYAVGTYDYQVRVRNAANCFSEWSDEVTATVNPKPDKPVINPVTNVCSGTSLTFEATAGFISYEWVSETATHTVTAVNTISASGSGVHSYTVRVQNAEGCWSDYSDVVSGEIYALPAKPVLNPLPAAEVCFDNPITLETAAGFSRYGWRETTTLTTENSTVNTKVLTASGTYAYQVRVRDANNCWSAWSDIVNVKIRDAIAQPVIDPVTNVCFGSTLTFTATPGYAEYIWDDGGTYDYTTVNTKSVSAAGVYSYSVFVKDAFGCESPQSEFVSGEIYAKPAKPVINALTDVCYPETLVFETAAGLARYSWRETTTGAVITNTSNTLSQTATGTYTYRVRVQDANGCWSDWSDEVTATVNPKPDKPVINAVADVCFGETLTFETAAGYPRYRWRINGVATASTDNTVTETAVGTYTYQVRVQNVEGCWSDWSDAVTATVKPKPDKPVINALADVCYPETLVFETAAGLARYRWQEIGSGAVTNSTDNTISHTAVGTYTYRVRVQNVEGCWSDWSDEVTATVNPKPDKPVINAIADVCFGETLTFETTAGYPRYRWRINGVTTASTDNTVIETAVGTYTYQVRVRNTEGCWSDWSDAVTATVKPKPDKPVIEPVADVCFDETLTFTTDAGYARYRWQEIGSGAVTNSTDNTISHTAVGTYTYRVRVQNVEGCWSDWSDEVTATVNPKPETPVITRVNDVCFGETIKFEAIPSTYSDYEWTETISGTVEMGGSVKEVSAVGVYNYIVRILNEEGCYSEYSDAVRGEIYPKPDKPVIEPVSDVCFDETLTFTADAGYVRYRWQEMGSGAVVTNTSNTMSHTAVGTYSYRVRVQNAEGCWSDWSDEVTATVKPKPETPVINPVEDVCFGETLTFETEAGYPRYRWRINGVVTTGTNNSVSETAVGTYTYEVRVRNAEGCWSDWSDEVTATVKPKPATPEISVADVCFGDTLTFITDGGYPRYRWNEMISGDLHNGNENTISQTSVGKYTYRVQVRNAEGCWSDYSAEVTGYVHPLPKRPSIEPAGTVAICEDGSITLTATSGLALYTWYLNGVEISSSASNTYSATEAGNYTVKVTTVYGCESKISDATTVEVIPYPAQPVITAAGLENGLVWRKTGMGIVFEVVNRLDTLVYQWYHNGSVITGGQGEALHLTGLRLDDAGLYSVTATTQKAQCSTMSDNVELIVREDVYIHNLITPNNDGQNDNLRIRGLEIYPHNELIIINRWGNQVFNTKDYVNGTWNGGSLPDGVYFYRLKLIEFNGYTEEKTGYFHLKR